MKIFFAIGYESIEKYIEKEMQGKARIVGYTVYREGIEKGVLNNNPDVVIIRETLTGTKSMLEIIYSLRKNHPNLRIIFMAGDRKPGDEMLSEIVNLGIYDIIIGGQINVKDIIDCILNPRTFKDVAYLKVKTLIDEKSNKKIFEAPEPTVEKEIKTVYIEKEVIKEAVQEENEKKPKEESLKIEDENKKESKDKEPKKTEEKSGVFSLFGKKSTSSNKGTNNEDKKIEKDTKDENRGLFNKSKNKISKQMIITFLGGKSGVGTSQIAFNTAVSLSKNGYKTLYINLDKDISSIDFIFQLGLYDKGIDTAISKSNQDNYTNIKNAIIDIDKVIEINSKDTQMINNYKKFPKNLSFMFYSKDYGTSPVKEELDSSGLKDICMYSLFKEQFEFIIIDTDSNIHNKFTKTAIEIATKVFFVMTQDVSTISSMITKQALINKNRINLDSNFYYILNKYENAYLSTKDISKWINKEINVVIPNINKEFINSNYIGIPLVLSCKNKEISTAFSKINKLIIN